MTINKPGRDRSRAPFTIPVSIYGSAPSGADTAALRLLVRELQEKLDEAFRRGLFTVVPRKKEVKKKKSKRAVSFRQFLRAKLRDPEFRRLYKSADIELRKRLESPL